MFILKWHLSTQYCVPGNFGPLRIEYAGVWYHVMNRGRRAENIFLAKEDYHRFLELLKESSELWNVGIAAYCLMPNITLSYADSNS